MKGPISMMGGKAKLAQKIVSLFPEHSIYVEPFGGGASVLFAKAPSPIEVYNDVNDGLVTFFRVLRSPQVKDMYYRLSLTPYARSEYLEARETWEQEQDEVEKACKWFTVAGQCFGGDVHGGWGYVREEPEGRSARTVKSWLSRIGRIPAAAERFSLVQVDHDDFRKVIKRFDSPNTLFYCDPPYVPSTRVSGEYDNELTEQAHHDLVDLLLAVQGKVVLSGYANPIYKRLEDAGWRRVDFDVLCHIQGKTGSRRGTPRSKRVESVWLNY